MFIRSLRMFVSIILLSLEAASCDTLLQIMSCKWFDHELVYITLHIDLAGQTNIGLDG